jgi:hypothetical protein
VPSHSRSTDLARAALGSDTHRIWQSRGLRTDGRDTGRQGRTTLLTEAEPRGRSDGGAGADGAADECRAATPEQGRMARLMEQRRTTLLTEAEPRVRVATPEQRWTTLQTEQGRAQRSAGAGGMRTNDRDTGRQGADSAADGAGARAKERRGGRTVRWPRRRLATCAEGWPRRRLARAKERRGGRTVLWPRRRLAACVEERRRWPRRRLGVRGPRRRLGVRGPRRRLKNYETLIVTSSDTMLLTLD